MSKHCNLVSLLCKYVVICLGLVVNWLIRIGLDFYHNMRWHVARCNHQMRLRTFSQNHVQPEIKFCDVLLCIIICYIHVHHYGSGNQSYVVWFRL